jgi:hypothetical protein
VRWIQYLLARQPFIILLVVLADVHKLRALEVGDFDPPRISTRGELERSASPSGYAMIGCKYLEEFILRLGAAGCIGLLGLLGLRSTAFIILYEVVGFIVIALITTAFARLYHFDWS